MTMQDISDVFHVNNVWLFIIKEFFIEALFHMENIWT